MTKEEFIAFIDRNDGLAGELSAAHPNDSRLRLVRSAFSEAREFAKNKWLDSAKDQELRFDSSLDEVIAIEARFLGAVIKLNEFVAELKAAQGVSANN